MNVGMPTISAEVSLSRRVRMLIAACADPGRAADMRRPAGCDRRGVGRGRLWPAGHDGRRGVGRGSGSRAAGVS